MEPFPSTRLRLELFREKAVALSVAAVDVVFGKNKIV
jgi:hypothetical protein